MNIVCISNIIEVGNTALYDITLGKVYKAYCEDSDDYYQVCIYDGYPIYVKYPKILFKDICEERNKKLIELGI